MAASTNNMPESEILVSSVSGSSLVKSAPIFSFDSKCLFCCSDTIVKVYSVESGECIRNLEGHTDTVTGVVTNPHNKLQILSCSTDQTIMQWDYSDGVLLRTYQFHHPLYEIDVLHWHDHPTLILKRQFSRQEYDIVECELPTKKDGKPEIKSLLVTNSSTGNSMAIGCQNKVIAIINRNCLTVKSSKKRKDHSVKETTFTCVACHPTDVCVVTGCENGKIFFWYNIFSKDKVTKSLSHWHALPVLDLCFTTEGSYLLSGGHECVLVKWQYNSSEKDFLPRLGAPINHLACSKDNLLYATCHTDNVIQIVDSDFRLKQVYQGLTCGHHFSQLIHPVPAGLHYEPRSKALVTNGKIGHLQFYSLTNDKHLYNLDIVGQNYVSPANMESTLTVTEIIALDFSSHGDWLITAEMWDDGVMTPEIRLKFWRFKDETQSYTLNTSVEMPHNQKVTCVKIRPETGEEDDEPMAVTTSQDGYFKTWTHVDDTNIYRENTKWNCTFSGNYRGQPANVASYSGDGSLLSIGFGSVLTIWEPDSNVLLQTLTNHKDQSDIKFIEFGKYSCSHLLVVCSGTNLTTWNLATCTVVWSLPVEPVSLVADLHTDVMAVISADSNVFYFKPSSPDTLYKHSNISQKPIISATFIPQTTTNKGRQLPTNSKLYCINSQHQLLSLSEVDPSQNTQKSELTIARNLPKTTLSMILSHSKPSTVEQTLLSKDTTPWKEFLNTPPQVQPAVTSLCKQFIQSMLVKTGVESSEKEDDEKDSSDSESVMDVDANSDSDSDIETNKDRKGKHSENINTTLTSSTKTSTDISRTSHQSDLTEIDIHDMDWYKHKL